MARRVLIALGVCIAAAVVEGLCSGTQVQERFDALRLPAGSLPLSGWIVIGLFYYAMCFVIVFRVLRHPPDAPYRRTALLLLLALMAANAGWNLLFFRTDHLLLALLSFIPYVAIAVGLLLALWRIDRPAASVVVPYALYLVYVTTWTYRLWQLNPAT